MNLHQLSVPADLLLRRDGVRILLLRDIRENGQLLRQSLRLLGLLILLVDLKAVLVRRLLGDGAEVLRVEVEVLLEDTAAGLALQTLGPLGR